MSKSTWNKQEGMNKWFVLNKQSLIILTAILAEQNISNNIIWNCIQTDIINTLDDESQRYSKDERFMLSQQAESLLISSDLMSQAHLLDCLYRTSFMNVNPDLVNKIGKEALESLILETDKKEDQIDVLKFYRGIFCNRLLTGSTLTDM
jgi:hypothetical protein